MIASASLDDKDESENAHAVEQPEIILGPAPIPAVNAWFKQSSQQRKDSKEEADLQNSNASKDGTEVPLICKTTEADRGSELKDRSLQFLFDLGNFFDLKNNRCGEAIAFQIEANSVNITKTLCHPIKKKDNFSERKDSKEETDLQNSNASKDGTEIALICKTAEADRGNELKDRSVQFLFDLKNFFDLKNNHCGEAIAVQIEANSVKYVGTVLGTEGINLFELTQLAPEMPSSTDPAKTPAPAQKHEETGSDKKVADVDGNAWPSLIEALGDEQKQESTPVIANPKGVAAAASASDDSGKVVEEASEAAQLAPEMPSSTDPAKATAPAQKHEETRSDTKVCMSR
ncbi:unnamed protein product [Gongylonema pulchrum]|uniref:NPL domain-containing protein n=1 Tax=Gongylonema pulchrum TaxID=637853 RepID=A0A183E0V3_9BILA|nr:unnamed protein product [Gongylonema pulchrum]